MSEKTELRFLSKLKAGDHSCFIFEHEEEHRIVLSRFIRLGLEHNEKVLYILNEHTEETILSYLGNTKLTKKELLSGGQLTFFTRDDACFRKAEFTPKMLFSFMQAESKQAHKEGYQALRITFEMTWALKWALDLERLLDYEIELNKFVSDSKCIVLCQYSRQDFDLGLLSVVQHSHPFSILNTEIYENYSFVSPVELSVDNLTTQAIDSWARNLASRQQVEEEFAGSRQLAQTLIDGVNSPIMIIDTDHKVRMMNRVAREQYAKGLETEHLVCYRISHNRDTPCTGEEHPCPLAQVLESRRPVSITHDHIHSTGEERVVEIVASPLFGSDNSIKGIVETMWDVTDQKRAKEAYLDSEKRFRDFAMVAADAIVLADSEWNIIFWNRTAQKIFGYSEEEILGKSLTFLIHKSQLKIFSDNINQIQMSSDQEVFGKMLEVSGSRKDGSVFPAEYSISSWQVDHEVFYCALVRDMSEIQEMQRRVLLQDRLAAAGQLAAGIAHDFNNIMVPIILYSELILDDSDVKPDSRRRLEKIIQQAQRAKSLTQQFLDFSRKGVIETRDINLQEFIADIIELLRRTLPENININLKCKSDDYSVSADPSRMQQVFINLALNARDAQPDGGELWFELSQLRVEPDEHPPYRDMSPGIWISVRVGDSGTGISPEVLPHIFEPFFTTKPTGEGTGLGLSQVYGLVKKHNGYIDVESALGEGTIFTIYLPGLGTPTKSFKMPDVEEKIKGNGEVIMLVEDDPAVRDALSEALVSLNYSVIVASNGNEAQELVDQNSEKVDLVISDMVMPDLGGPALLKILREKRPALKMVMITGYHLGYGTRELLDRRQVSWIQKPVDANTLAQTVHAILVGDGG